MRKWALIFGISIVAANSFGQVVKVTDYQGDGQGADYNFTYSRAHETSVTGKVVGKVKGSPRNGKAESMAILVKDSKGKVYSVDLGPTWYVGDQVTSINIGDKVRVLGELVEMKSSSANTEKFFVARQIRKGGSVLALRDLNGNPYWNARRPGHYAIQGTGNSISGQIVSQNTVNAENQEQVAYQVKTQDGLVNVAIAPNWYLEQQNLGFHVGDAITVYTGAGPSHFGNNVILADGLYGYGGTVVLRPNGVPVWNGWSNGR